MYSVVAGNKEDVVSAVNERRKDWVPYGAPLWTGTEYVQLQVARDSRAPLFQALQDMASNCPPTNTSTENLMSKAMSPILAELKSDPLV